MHNNEKYYYVTVDDTKKYGVVQAVILGRIRWWCQYNEEQKDEDKFHDGYYWSGWMTGKDFEEQTGIPDKTIYRNLNELIANKIIYRERFNKMKRDKSGWYRINPNSQNENTNSQNENTLPVNLPINQSENLSENILHHNTGVDITPKKKRKQIFAQLLETLPRFNISDDTKEILFKLITNKEFDRIAGTEDRELTEQEKNLIKEFIELSST